MVRSFVFGVAGILLVTTILAGQALHSSLVKQIGRSATQVALYQLESLERELEYRIDTVERVAASSGVYNALVDAESWRAAATTGTRSGRGPIHVLQPVSRRLFEPDQLLGLSRKQQRRLAIAQALLCRPKILLLDEPPPLSADSPKQPSLLPCSTYEAKSQWSSSLTGNESCVPPTQPSSWTMAKS